MDRDRDRDRDRASKTTSQIKSTKTILGSAKSPPKSQFQQAPDKSAPDKSKVIEAELRKRIRQLETDLRTEAQEHRTKEQEADRSFQAQRRILDEAKKEQTQLRGSLTMTRWISGIFCIGLCGISIFSYGQFHEEKKLQQAIASTTDQLNITKQKMTSTLADLTSTQSTVTSLQGQLAKAKQQTEQTEADLSTAQAHLTALKTELAEKTLTLTTLKTESSNQAQTIKAEQQALVDELQTAQTEIQTLTTQLAEANTQQAILEESLTLAQAENEAQKRANNTILADNSKAMNDLTIEINAHKKQASDLKQQNMELKDSLTQSQKDLSVKEMALDEKDEAIQQLKNQIKEAEQSMMPMVEPK